MKKLILTVTMTVLTFMLNGCCGECGKPKEWDITKDSNWEVYAKGKITNIKIVQGCTGDHKTREQWCKEAYEFSINNNIPVLVGNLRNPGLVKVGETGILYKYGNRLKNKKAWFQWVVKESPYITDNVREKDIVKKSKAITKKDPIFTIKKDKPIINEWIKSDDIDNLKPNDFVLIKLDNDIIAIGFITYDKKWKLSFNINKYQYGKTLDNVLMWKRINLE